MYNEIITHDGNFHADEVLAIAVVRHFYGKIRVRRTYDKSVIEAGKNTQDTLVLDCGMEYDQTRLNFDHHQDGTIEATNLLVLRHFCKDTELVQLLEKHLFGYVDKVDRGMVVENGETPTFNSIIRMLNAVPNGFELAVTVADTALLGAIETAKQAIEGRTMWRNVTRYYYMPVVLHKGPPIVGWRELAEEDGILAMMHPNPRQEGSFSITVRDSDICTIPKITNGGQSFCHANGFAASYDTLEDAVRHAEAIFEI